MVILAMYKGKGNIANSLIRWRTDSIYSHCEFIIDGMWYSSTVEDHGVVKRNRREKNNFHDEDWDYFPLPWLPDSWVIDYFEETQEQPYGWLDLIQSQLVGRATRNDVGDFCSEWMAACAKLPNPQEFSPRKLMEVLLWRCQPTETLTNEHTP